MERPPGDGLPLAPNKSPDLPTWTEKELNLGTVDDYTLSLLDSLGVMLASSPKGLHVVDLLSSCSLAAFQKEPAGASKWDVLFKFIGDPKRLIAIKNNEVRLLAPDSQGAIPLGSLTKAVDSQLMTFELSYYEMCELARTLHTLDLSSVNPEFSAFVTQIIKESQKIRQFPSNRHFPWNTHVFRVPFAAVAPVYATLLPTIPEPQRSPAAYALLEKFKMYAQTIKDTQSYSVETTPGSMKDSNCEVVRLRSFAEWPRTENDFYATPQKLARAGFYYDPKPVPLSTGQLSGLDRCVCYSCQLPLVNLEANDDPWEEHSQQSPVCKFVQGRDPSNIPLSVTLNASPSKRHGSEAQTVVTVAAVQDIVATGSADGFVVFWDISLELKQLHSFNALRESTWVDAKNPGAASSITLQHLLFVPCTPNDRSAAAPSNRGNEKWSGWCTLGVQVEVTAQLYAGAKGVVFDILGDDLICVYVTGLNEVMTFSLSQIRACRPKVNQRCKILSGPHKGETGLLVSASGNQGFVRVHRTKQVVGVEFESLSWISDEAAASIESEVNAQTTAPDSCLLSIFSSGAFGLSLLTLFQYSKNSTKFMQALTCDHGLITAAEYLPSKKRILALCKQSDGGFVLAAFAYDPSGRRISPIAAAPLKLKPGDDFIPNVARWEGDTSVVVMTTRGQVLIFSPDTLLLLSTAQIGGEETKREYTDFEVSEREQQLSCISKAGTLHQLSLSSPTPPPVDVQSLATLPTSNIDGATTLTNLIAIKEIDVERLRFFSYASPSAKQTQVSEKEGTLVKWIMIPTELSRTNEVQFELELPQVGLVDRIDMLIGYTGLDPEEKEDWPKCSLAVSYSMGDAKWQKLLDKIDLFALAMCNTENQSLNEYDQSVTESAISISTQVTARRLLLTITVQSPAESPRTPTGLRTLSTSLYGYSTRTSPSLLNYTKRLALFSSSDFHLSLLRLVQQDATTVDLRNVALDLLWAEYASKEERTSFLIGHTDLRAYMKNVIYFGSTTSKKAARLLLRMAQVSAEFSAKCLEVCLELLPVAVDSSVSHGCLQQVVALISQCWSSAPEKAHKICTKELLQLGEKLNKNRNPLYNILQTHFGLYGFPLEPDVFEAKPVMGKLNNEMEGDELSFKFTESSSNATGDSKKRRMRFTKVQRSGNWFVVDLGTTCLVTELVIDYVFDHQSTWGYVTVETALDNIQNVQSTSRLASEKLGGAKRGGKKLLTMRRLNRMCRFLKFDVKLSSMRQGDQGISFVLDVFGIQDYIALTLPGDVLIPKLETVILSSEEKRHKTAADFAQRRRLLCAKLEEINLSGDAYTNHIQEISTMFYNCMQAQLDHHWLNRRVVRLRLLQASFLPGVTATGVQNSLVGQLDDRLDRWSSAAELLVSCLVTKEEDLHDAKTLQQLFDYFMIYSTPSLREKVSDLISYQLERWPTFASDVLSRYFFSTSSSTDATLFPQQEVFQLVLRTLRDQQPRKPFTDELFSYLHRLTQQATAVMRMPSSESAVLSVDTPRSIDLTLSSWLLLLLSQVMSDEVTSTDTVHEGVKCRGCGMCPIRGLRYSCVNCISYDLCEKCESESKHIKWHLFLKVPQAVEPPETYTPDASVAPLEEPLLPVLYPQGFEDEPSVSASAKLSSAMIACASCGQTPISHPHFKCACCDDYHLCAQCEGLVDHQPTHLFLKINIPLQYNLDQSSGIQLERALFPNPAMLAYVLSYATESDDEETPAVSKSPMNPRQRPQEEHRPLASIVSLLAITTSQLPANPEVVLLGCRVLEELVGKFAPEDVLHDVVQHSQFGSLLQRAARHSNAFVHSSLVRMLERLLATSEADTTNHSGAIRTQLRQQVAGFFVHTKLPEDAVQFLLELLLLTAQTRTAQTAITLDSATGAGLIRVVLQSCELAMPSAVKPWCILLRLLQAMPGADLCAAALAQQTREVVRSVLRAPAELRVLLAPDFARFLNALLGCAGSDHMQADLLADLAQMFEYADLDAKAPAFAQLVEALKTNVHSAAPFRAADVASLLSQTASKLSQDSSQISDLCVSVLELINAIMWSTGGTGSSVALIAGVLAAPQTPNFSRKLLLWLSNGTDDASGAAIPSQSGDSRGASLRAELLRLIQVLCQPDEGAKFLLRLCVVALRENVHSHMLVQLCLQLVRTEDLAAFFAVELGAATFLFNHVARGSSKAFRANISSGAAILSTLLKADAKGSKSAQAHRTGAGGTRDGTLLNSLCRVMAPKNDHLLQRMFRESEMGKNRQSGFTWTYLFSQHSKLEAPSDSIDVVIATSSDVVLSEISVTCVLNQSVAGSRSQLPPWIAVETGTSIDRLIPCGRFNCVLPASVNPSHQYPNTFKYVLPAPQVVRVLRLRFHAPSKASPIAVSGIYLLGHTLASFFESRSEKVAASARSNRGALQLLSHAMRYDKVQGHFAGEETTKQLALALLRTLSIDTRQAVQDILWHFVQRDANLADLLLKQTLVDDQTAFHAEFAGQLCVLRDSHQAGRLNLLRTFVFGALRKQTPDKPLSSSLTPFLTALAHAVRQSQDVQFALDGDELLALYKCALHALEGSLLKDAALRLLSAFVHANSKLYKQLLSLGGMSADTLDAILNAKPSPLAVLGVLASSSHECGRTLLDSGILQRMKARLATDSRNDAAVEELLQFLGNVAYESRVLKPWFGENMLDTLLHVCASNPAVVFEVLRVLRTCANLSRPNQGHVAALLLKQFDSAEPPSEHMLSLIIELLSMTDTVSVCVERLQGTAPLVSPAGSSTGGKNKAQLQFDARLTDPALMEIDKDRTSVSCISGPQKLWRTALINYPMTSGTHRWEVVVNRMTNENVMIGVCERISKFAGSYIGQSHGYAYFGSRPGYFTHQDSSRAYGGPLKTGDVVGVEINFDEGTLSFSCNGIDWGAAYSSGFDDKELYPAVSLLDAGDQVTFRTASSATAEIARASSSSMMVPSGRSDTAEDLLRFQRASDVMNLPLDTSLEDLATSLALDPKHVTFHLRNSSAALVNTLTLGDILSDLPGTELVDLLWEFSSAANRNRATLPSGQQPSAKRTASVPPLFKIFAERGGLSKLVALVTGRSAKSNSPVALVDPSGNRALWAAWLFQLQTHLQVPGYALGFAAHTECRELFLRLLLRRDESPANPSTVFDVLSSVMFQLWSAPATPAQALQVRRLSITSGSLAIILERLAETANIEHRNKEPFAAVAAYRKPKKPTAADSKSADDSRKDSKSSKSESKPAAVSSAYSHSLGGGGGTPGNSSKKDSSHEYWKKGTGYGTPDDDHRATGWNIAGAVKQQEQRAAQIAQLLNGLVAMLEPASSAQGLDYGVLVHEGLVSLLDSSCLMPLLESYLRSDSVLDMVKERTAYHAVLAMLLALAKNPLLVPLLEGQLSASGAVDEKPARIEELLQNLRAATSVVLQQKGKFASVDVEHEESTALAQEIGQAATQVQSLLQAHRAARKSAPATAVVKEPSTPVGAAPSAASAAGSELEAQYKSAMKPLQFAEFGMKDSRGDYVHHYRQRIASEKIGMGPKMKRLIQEVSALATGLPLSLSSSVFLRVDSERIDVMKALIIGPVDTPYQNGCFQFDIYCPQEYPNGPPVVNLETTGGGTVRFNPNLYADGKVCLSLLGTWSGGENEKWNAKTSTLLQVLVSIQSLILVEQPYFNEPGYEREMSTPTGQSNSRAYNENIRLQTLRYAVLEQLRRSSPGFEEVIRTHFRSKRTELLNQCRIWQSEAESSRDQLRQLIADIRVELQKLDPSTPLQDPPPMPDRKQKEKEEKEALRVTAALDIQENLAPQFPLGLILRALEQQNDSTEAAVNWLFEHGEAELLKNPSLAKTAEFQF